MRGEETASIAYARHSDTADVILVEEDSHQGDEKLPEETGKSGAADSMHPVISSGMSVPGTERLWVKVAVGKLPKQGIDAVLEVVEAICRTQVTGH